MKSNVAPQGMVVTPHHLASQSAVNILREGGNAIEAMVAAAATIAVVMPHNNSIGGDGFWLIVPPDGEPVVIEACGVAGSLATPEFFTGLSKIPSKGSKSAITVAGTVAGWEEALRYSAEKGYKRKSIHKLLADAIRYAEEGVDVTESQRIKLEEVKGKIRSVEFCKIFLADGKIPRVGDIIYQKTLAKTLRTLSENGLIDFYRGEVAKNIALDAASLGLPITEKDLAEHSSVRKVPLRLLHKYGEVFNVPPPSQGVSSLGILGALDKLDIKGDHTGELIHATVEATKLAFKLRDRYVTDPCEMKIDPQTLLASDILLNMANEIDVNKAASYGRAKGPGDTVWMGVMDNKGFSVTLIQSIYQAFGSGVVLPSSGILWQNRGAAFTLETNHMLYIKPGKKPLHTLNTAVAKLHDGRVMIYGTSGGDGQPQTQAAIFHRYVVQGKGLQSSVSDPRWLYGRTTDDINNDLLKLEGRFGQNTIDYLKKRGHEIVMVTDYDLVMGNAGALVRHPNGMIEGAFDPRSNGSAAGF